MAYSYSDYYSNRRPSRSITPDPSFVAAGQWPVGQMGDIMGRQNAGMPLMYGGKPGTPNFQNSFGNVNYGQELGTMSPTTQPSMPQPSLTPKRKNLNPMSGMPGFGSGDPFEFLLGAMGGMGMPVPGQQQIKVPKGIDPQRYSQMTPEERWQVSQAGPSPGDGYQLVPVPIRLPGQPISRQWKWQKIAPVGNF